MSAGGPRADPVTPGPELAARPVASLLGCLASSTPTPAQSGLLSGPGSWWRLRGASQVQVRADGGSPGLWEVCFHAPPEAPVWGLPPCPSWGRVQLRRRSGRVHRERGPRCFPRGGGRSCGNGTWFPDASLHSPSELVWSRRCLEEAGPRAAGGGQKAEGVALTLLREPVLQQKGLSSPSSRGAHTDPGSRTCLLCGVVLRSASPLVSLPR